MDIRKIKKLIELVEESGISELEISEGEESVRISRAAPAASFPVMQQAYAAPMMQQPAQSNAAAPATVPSMEAPPFSAVFPPSPYHTLGRKATGQKKTN